MVCTKTNFLLYHIYLFILLAFFHFVAFFQAIQTTNIIEEWVGQAHAQFKDEKACQVSTIKTPAMAENKIKDLGTKLTEANREKMSAKASLTNVEKQVEDQCQQLRKAEEQLSRVD